MVISKEEIERLKVAAESANAARAAQAEATRNWLQSLDAPLDVLRFFGVAGKGSNGNNGKQPLAAQAAPQVEAPTMMSIQAMRAQLKPCPIITAAQPVSVPFVQVVDATPQPVGVTTVAAQQKAPRKKKGASK